MRAGKLEGTESLSVASDLKSEAAKLSNGGKPRQRIELILTPLSPFQATTAQELRLPSKAEGFSLLLKNASCTNVALMVLPVAGNILVLVAADESARQTWAIQPWSEEEEKAQQSRYLGFGTLTAQVSSLAFKIPSFQPCQRFYKYPELRRKLNHQVKCFDTVSLLYCTSYIRSFSNTILQNGLKWCLCIK